MNQIFFKSRLIAFLMFFVMFVSANVSAYEIESNLCKCTSCEDCTDALHNKACSVVQLIIDLTESTMGKSSASCIVNPPFSDGKTFDCNNHKIERCPTCGQKDTYGVYLRDKKNMLIKNCNIINFDIGIGIYSSSDIKVTNNKFSNGHTGVYLNGTTKCDIEGNVIGNMENGIHLSESDYNTVANNDLTGIKGNTAMAIFLEESSENLIKNNNANGKKEKGIFLKESDDNTINGNSVNECTVGIQIEHSSSNNISENKGSNCQESAILLTYSSKNKISKNNVNSNKKYGIQLLRSDKNLITLNEMKNNIFSYGLSVEYSSDNNISENLILSNRAGIHSTQSKNFISGNKVCRNKEYDFDSSDWMKSEGYNNYCDISGVWNDINASRCSKKCKCESNDECNDDESCKNAGCEKLNCGKIYEHKCVECLNDSDCLKSENERDEGRKNYK
ncbi:MAG: hypothetical protein CVT89_05290 [Candidatus Altiarchaeales archaeon HGW-Altiarchaeales-2]|nr:MAG: hypothetical protein CVT89_05290 [Candidatus Altiarchaeales archaeon HGW-Altiarchaeales-2]